MTAQRLPLPRRIIFVVAALLTFSVLSTAHAPSRAAPLLTTNLPQSDLPLPILAPHLRPLPVPADVSPNIITSQSATAIAAGYAHTCALTSGAVMI